MQGSILFISGQEIVMIFVVFLLLFGAKSVPDLAKGLGKGLREFKKATEDIKKEEATGHPMQSTPALRGNASREAQPCFSKFPARLEWRHQQAQR